MTGAEDASAMALAAFAGGFATALRPGAFGPTRTPVRSEAQRLFDARDPIMAELPTAAVPLARVGAFILMAHVIARLPWMDAASRRAA